MRLNLVTLTPLAGGGMPIVRLMVFLLAACALTHARADEGPKPENLAALQDEVRTLQQQVSWLIAHVQKQKKAISELSALVDSQNALIAQLRNQAPDTQSESPRRIQTFRKTRFGWNSDPGEAAQRTVLAVGP